METHILVTGASRGIGAAIAQSFDPDKVHVRALSSRDGDLADPAVPQKIWNNALAELNGRIDVLINNAGIFEANPIGVDDDIWRESWNRTLQVNLTASAELCRLAVLHWQSTKAAGRIVNIASRAAHRGDSPDHWHYAASKAGMVAMTKTIARAYAAQADLRFCDLSGLHDDWNGRGLSGKPRRR